MLESGNDITHLLTSFVPSIIVYARMVFEDTYLMIHDADGEEWADTIRYKMHDQAADPVTETSGLLPAAVYS